MTQIVAAEQARADLLRLINDAFLEKERFIIQSAGVEKAVLLGIGEYRRLTSTNQQARERRFRRLLQIAARNRDIPPEQVEKDVQEAVAAVREPFDRTTLTPLGKRGPGL